MMKSMKTNVFCSVFLFLLIIALYRDANSGALRSFGSLGGSGTKTALFFTAEDTDGCPGKMLQMIITLRLESDGPDPNIDELSFTLNYYDSVFGYNSIQQFSIVELMDMDVTTGDGYITVTLSSNIKKVFFERHVKKPILSIWFTVDSVAALGEYPFTFSNPNIYKIDGVVQITQPAFSVSLLETTEFPNDTRPRLRITGSGFSPYTKAMLVSDRITQSECDYIYSVRSESPSQDVLYTMFDLPTACVGNYTLHLGRCGGDFRYQYGIQEPLDTGQRISIKAETSESFFTNVTDMAGLSSVGTGNGLAVGDFDNDGDEDFILCRENLSINLMENDGHGAFSNVSNLIIGNIPSAFVASWADYDNDGDLDLMIDISLFENRLIPDGVVSFLKKTDFHELPDDSPIRGMAWADYNNDGLIDVFLARSEGGEGWAVHTNQLWKNDGNDFFHDVTKTSGILENFDLNTIGCAWGDYDNDGFMDLYVCNGPPFDTASPTRPIPNSLYKNVGGNSFQRSSAGITGELHSSNGVVWIDYNNDGFQDLHVTNNSNIFVYDTRNDYLLKNNGDGSFTNNSVTYGIFNDLDSFGVSWSDWDLGGFQEPFVAVADTDPVSISQLNKELSIGGEVTTYDQARRLGFLDPTLPKSINTSVWFDYDNDGDLDLLLTAEDSMGNLVFLQNQVKDGDDTLKYLKIRLHGSQSNSYGVGCRIQVTEGSRDMYRYITAGDGYLKQDGLIAHFGLAEVDETIDQIRIEWTSSEPTILNNVAADIFLHIYEPAGCSSDDPVVGTLRGSDIDHSMKSGVQLTWSDPIWSDNDNGHRCFYIYRDSVLLNIVSEETLGYIDKTGIENQSYIYQVVAVDGCGATTVFNSITLSDDATPGNSKFISGE